MNASESEKRRVSGISCVRPILYSLYCPNWKPYIGGILLPFVIGFMFIIPAWYQLEKKGFVVAAGIGLPITRNLHSPGMFWEQISEKTGFFFRTSGEIKQTTCRIKYHIVILDCTNSQIIKWLGIFCHFWSTN
jgi:hypothetical protein